MVIKGWFMRGERYRPDSRETPLLVFMHGSKGNLGLRLRYFKKLVSKVGVNVLAMAYRGYSDSDDVQINEEGIKKDANAIIRFLNDVGSSEFPHLATHVNKKLIILQGRGLGGAVAAYMAAERP